MAMMTLAAALRQACSPETGGLARVDAEWLMAHVLGKSRTWLYAFPEHVLPAAQTADFLQLAARRQRGEPVAYLTGRRGFWTFELRVTPDTLIPRPETELLVESALACLPPESACTVLDLGTGSGAIALAIGRERPQARITAVDASPAALAVARANAEALAIGNVAFQHSDWFTALGDARFDVIVSNPPYIEADDPHLGQGDLRFEPASALVSGGDGLDDIRRILAAAPGHLQPGGHVLIEHGWNQGAAVRTLFIAADLGEVRTLRDLEDRDRVTIGRIL